MAKFPGRASAGVMRNGAQLKIVMIGIFLSGLLQVTRGGDPQSLDANLQAIICSLVYVGKSARGKRAPIDDKSLLREQM